MSTYTTDDLAAINQAIVNGTLVVKYNDREVKYRSMDELLKAKRLIENDLGIKKRSARLLCKTKKGTV